MIPRLFHIFRNTPLGRETLLHVLPEGKTQEPLRVLAPGKTGVAAGATVGLRLRRNRFHLFDADSGERLRDFEARE